MWTCLAEASFALVMFFTQGTHFQSGHVLRAMGQFSTPYALYVLLGIGTVLALDYLISAPAKKAPPMALVCAGVFFIALFAVAFRGLALAVTASCVVLAVGTSSPILRKVMVVGMCGLLLASIFVLRNFDAASARATTGSDRSRIALSSQALSSLGASFPLGRGIGNLHYSVDSQRAGNGVPGSRSYMMATTKNMYLQAVAETGLVGIALIGSLSLYIADTLRKCTSHADLVWAAILIGGCVSGLVDTAVGSTAPAISNALLALILTMTVIRRPSGSV
jgi:hypothetical protein